MVILKQLARLWLLCAILVLAERHASAQEWQAYQLTHFVQPGQVINCESVADSFGNLHHFINCLVGLHLDWANLYYLRTDFFGHILTDTTLIYSYVDTVGLSQYVAVVTDGANAWCMYRGWIPNQGLHSGLYMTGRNSEGEEIMPHTLVVEAEGLPPIHGFLPEMDAVLRMQDTTVHFFGEVSPFSYLRMTTQAETLMWIRQVDGLHNECWATHIRLGPDGAPWAAACNTRTGGREILLVRFGEDTSQTVYHLSIGGVNSVSPRGFGIDSTYHFHFLIGSDTTTGGYAKLDSSLVLQEWRCLAPSTDTAYRDLKTDPAGNTIMAWSAGGTIIGLRWAFRRADGVWTHPPQEVDHTRLGNEFSFVMLDTARFAFTTQTNPWPGDYRQLWLYTHGLGPDTTLSAICRPPTVAVPALRVHPNPFGSTFSVELPNTPGQALVLYDLLGREVWSHPLASGERTLEISDPRLSTLPSGTYFLALRGGPHSVSFPVTHFK